MDGEIVKKQFGIRVRQFRSEQGMSQEALADAAGLDRTYVGGVERGERNVTLTSANKIALGLGVSLRELF